VNRLPEATSGPINILYVEDNVDIRDVVLELIARDDRRIVACADAEVAWAHLQRGAFDVLVTDVNLPGASGTDLARRWLAGDATRWVILFTGYEFKSGLTSLGSQVRAVLKEDFEQLDMALAEIWEQLRHRTGDGV
jgi:CheY-like chemotaxis protein